MTATLDTTPPTVSISSPTSGTTYTTAQTVTISATASDNVGVSKVEFYDGATLKATDTSSPYSYGWPITTTDNGSHSWSAKAYDAALNTTTSGIVSLAVNIVATCNYSITPTGNTTVPSAGGNYSVSITAPAGCSWTATSGVSWATITSGTSGTGNGTVTYSVSPNTTTISRSTTLTIAGKSFGVTQAGTYLTSPTAPTNLTATAVSGSQVNLAWTDNSTNETGFYVLQYTALGGWQTIATLSPDVTTYSATGLTAATSYSYFIRAFNAAGTSASNVVQVTTPSGTDTTPPTAPTNLTATAASCSQVNLAWTASTDNVGVAGYKIYRNSTLIFTTVTTGTTFQNTTVLPSTTYSYTVSAYDAAGNTSNQSVAAGATTPACADTTPPTVSISAPTSGTTYTTAQTVTISATASDNVGVTKVEFYDGATLKATDTSSPYSYGWPITTTDNGSHSWSAKAYDAALNTTTSGVVNLTVNIPVATYTITTTASPTVGGATFGGGTYASGASVTVTATPNSGYNFVNWMENSTAVSTSPTYSFTATANRSLVGNFNPIVISGPWVKGIGGVGSDVGKVVAVDANNNFLTAGHFQGTVDFGGATCSSVSGSDIFVAKYTSAGTLLWCKSFGGTIDENVNGIAAAPNGDVWFTGFFTGSLSFGGATLVSTGARDMFLTKLSGATGAYLWSQRFGSVNDDVGYTVATDANSNVLLTGYFMGTVNFGGTTLVSSTDGTDTDLFLAKFSSAGTHLWSKNFINGGFESGRGVAIDGNGNVFLAGTFNGLIDFGSGTFLQANNGYNDIFLAKFTSGGGYLWAKSFGGSNQDYGQAVAVDGNGDVAITGSTLGAVDFGDGLVSGGSARNIFVAKYIGANGSHIWSKVIGSSSNNEGESVAADASGNVTITGYFQNTVNFGGGNLTSAGGYDVFVAKYSSTGAYLWSNRLGGANYDYGSAVTAVGSGEVLVTGYFADTADFNGTSLTSTGGNDIFLMKMAP